MDHADAPDANTPDTDSDADFRQLFTSTYQTLSAYARRRTVDHAEADDVVAEVYATAWRRRHDRDRDANPMPWLYGIAANVIRNSRRAGSRRLRLVERLQAEPAPSGSEPPDSGATDPDLLEALARLSFDDQEVLRLVAWEGLSHAEAGLALDCSTNAVGIRIHRARQRLQEQLFEQEDRSTRRGGANR